jgi:cytochrome b6-f complex iron-sulfur subunit
MAEEVKKETRSDPAIPRRNFLTWLWGLLGLAAFAEIIWLVASFLRPNGKRLKTEKATTLMAAGRVDAFHPGTVTAFPRGRFYLARLADGGFLAFSRRCTHLGCTVPWVAEEKRFLCPCHSSAFDIHGDVLRSPAPRALDLFKVTIENNVVKVDTGKAVKRGRFKKEQVVYPEKG